jgi:hypothetical protein
MSDYTFDLYRACGVVEGFEDSSGEEETIAAWQWLIDTGHCWHLQGWYGRTAAELIQQGVCHNA